MLMLMKPFDHDTATAASAGPAASGFGLAIASALADEIGGILSVTFPPEGGTRVVLTLRRARPA